MRSPSIGISGPLSGHVSTFLKATPALGFIRLNSSISAAVSSAEINPTNYLDSIDSENSLIICHHEDFWNQQWSNSFLSEINERRRYYTVALRLCASEGYLDDGKAIHGQVIKNGICPDSHLWSSLVSVYAKCENFHCAGQVLEEMPKQDVVSWTALITGFLGQGYSSNGINSLCEMRKRGIQPNGHALVTGLRACSMCLDLQLGKQLHAEVIKVGVFSDVYVGSGLVDIYAKCGEIELAERVFSWMPEKNEVSWNALLNGYSQTGDGEEVLKLFSRMTELEVKFSKFTLTTVLKGLANSKNWRGAQAVHSLVIKIGHELNEFLTCCLLDMYSKSGLIDDAFKIFRRIKDPNVAAWSAMINCLYRQDQSREAVELFCLMRHKGIRPNQFTFASLVSAATSWGDLHYGESIHACICKYGFESDIFISNAVVTMYMKIQSVENGWQAFREMPIRNLASWNCLLSGICDTKACDQGPRIFSQMLAEGFKPDMFTFISIIGFCSAFSDVGFGKLLHAHVVKNGLDDNCCVGTALIDMYSKTQCLEDADVIFNRLRERDPLTWSVMIAGYAREGQGKNAVKCFNQMQREGVKPNTFTLSSCLSGCSHIKALEIGQQLHSLAIKAGQLAHIYVANALVDMYVICRCIEDAEAVFKGTASPNRVLWNTIICGYSQHGHGEKALEGFMIMLEEGTMPDEVTFLGVLSACSHMGLAEEGDRHFSSMSKVYGITPQIEHKACMVNILSRAGRFSEVRNFIKEMKLTQNALIWEIVLWASKMHGNVEFGQIAAKKIFELEPEKGYNYIQLSDIFAAKEMWDDVAKTRALMFNRGIKKRPACSWIEVDTDDSFILVSG